MRPWDDKPMYDVRLSLTVDDSGALWAAAAQHAMLIGAISEAEAVETLGSAQDPQVEDCVLMLMDPARFGGCTIATLTCAAHAHDRAPAAIEQHGATIGQRRANG